MIYLEGNSNDNIVSNTDTNYETSKDTSNRDYSNNESMVADKPVTTTRSGRIVNNISICSKLEYEHHLMLWLIKVMIIVKLLFDIHIDKDDSGNLSFDNEAKKVAWKQHYERLLNVEFSWSPEDLTADPVVGPPIHIDVEMVVKAITKMKTGKAAGLSE